MHIDTEYYDSDDTYSLEINSGDETGQTMRRRKPDRIIYDPNVKMPAFVVGMVFESAQQFRDAIAIYSVIKGCEVDFKKNENIRIKAVCSKKGYPWFIFASVENKMGDFKIKTYNPQHKCQRVYKNKRVTTKFLAIYYKDRICQAPGMKIADFKKLISEELKCNVSFVMCKRAKKDVMNELLGNYVEEYASLWRYIEELKETNPGTTVVLCIEPNTNKFWRLYICFDALKKGWKEGCRPIIGVDGCFLKIYCKGELLTAICRDGNNQILSIAWVVINVENKVNWIWFLQLLE